MLSVREKVTTLGVNGANLIGTIPNTEVYRYYHKNAACVFINNSINERLPGSTIVTDVGSTHEIILLEKVDTCYARSSL